MKRIDILTLFPNIFDSYINESLFKRAQKSKLLKITSHDIRAYLRTPKERVDDRPFGGGPGMVLKVEPVLRAVTDVKRKAERASTTVRRIKSRIILFSTRGTVLDAKTAKRLSSYDQLIFICGHYEGVDERVAEHIADEELSIGPYILSGGELPALVTIDAVARFWKGFLGKEESLEEIKGSYPAYTRPASFTPDPKKPKKKWHVPEVLTSGDHAKITAWRTRT